MPRSETKSVSFKEHESQTATQALAEQPKILARKQGWKHSLNRVQNSLAVLRAPGLLVPQINRNRCEGGLYLCVLAVCGTKGPQPTGFCCKSTEGSAAVPRGHRVQIAAGAPPARRGGATHDLLSCLNIRGINNRFRTITRI